VVNRTDSGQVQGFFVDTANNENVGYNSSSTSLYGGTALGIRMNQSGNLVENSISDAYSTKPTITGCGTPGNQKGGGWTGSFTSGAISCTPVLTNTAAAVTGRNCVISDQSIGTGALFMNLSSTTTTVTFPTLTTTVGDTIVFQCGLAF
jgi:hypothetical protein